MSRARMLAESDKPCEMKLPIASLGVMDEVISQLSADIAE